MKLQIDNPLLGGGNSEGYLEDKGKTSNPVI